MGCRERSAFLSMKKKTPFTMREKTKNETKKYFFIGILLANALP
jgi:hypothetical protein